MQSPVAITVDTSDLRSPGARKLSPHLLTPVQQRLQSWAPKSPTGKSFEEKIEGASRRRHSLVEERTSKLQESNTRVNIVAEQARAKFAEAAVSTAAHVAAKANSAEQKRKAMLSAKEASAANHFEHAKKVCSEQKALKKQKTELAMQSTTDKVNEAGARRASLLQQAQLRAALDVAKAKDLADKKRANLLQAKIKAEDKAAAAEARRASIHDNLMEKLSKKEEHSRQVRRNKGSTPSRTTANAETKITQPAVAFDIEIERSPPSPTGAKPAVQVRFEEDAAAREAPCSAPSSPDEKWAGATSRRLSLAEESAASVTKHNEHVKQVASKHAAERQAEIEAAKMASARRVAAAEERRQALLDTQLKKTTGHLEQVTNISATVTAKHQEKITEKKRRLSAEIEAAEVRRIESSPSKNAIKHNEHVKQVVARKMASLAA